MLWNPFLHRQENCFLNMFENELSSPYNEEISCIRMDATKSKQLTRRGRGNWLIADILACVCVSSVQVSPWRQ